MSNLTENWKNKELKWHKSYYCKNKKGEIAIATLMGDDVLYSAELGGTLNFGYWEVLAECDYEELQRLESDSLAKNEGVEIVAELKEENAKQKELIKKLGDDIELLEIKKSILITEYNELYQLLKEWVEAYPVVAVTCDIRNFVKIQELLDKTNEVLK